MPSSQKRSAAAWFNEAVHSYVEGHQACAWCGGRHCVFQTERGPLQEYYCNHCNFYVSHDRQSGKHHAVPGTNRVAADAC